MTAVIKKNGDREPFDQLKMRKSIEKAAVDAHNLIPESLVEEVARSVEKKVRAHDTIESSAIRTEILNELEKRERSTAEAWRRFDAKYKALARGVA